MLRRSWIGEGGLVLYEMEGSRRGKMGVVGYVGFCDTMWI